MTSSLVYNLNQLSNTIDNVDVVNRGDKVFIKKCFLKNNCANRINYNKNNTFSNIVETPTTIDDIVGESIDNNCLMSSSSLTTRKFSAINKNKINCISADGSNGVGGCINNHRIKCLNNSNNNINKKSGIISLGIIKNLIYIILLINLLKTNIIIVNCLPSPHPNNNNQQQQQQQQQQSGGIGNIGNLESSIAAIFSKVAYGTTTKRSIPDNGFITSLTTVPTPLLTTFRYREREKEDELLRQQQQQQQQHQQQIPQQTLGNNNNNNNNQQQQRHRNYELVLEMDHALPTSAPNADILKSNNNPTYPNPNRHHNHERERHRHFNSTPSPGYNQLKKGQQPTIAMYSIDMPSYSPPSRSFFTPPLPPEYQNPFADKPTLRGTNSDSGIINTNQYINRRPLPPPSLMPGHERIPLRPPDLVGTGFSTNQGLNTGNNNNDGNNQEQQLPLSKSSNVDQQIIGVLNTDNYRKKALNTPSQKVHQMDMNSNLDGRRLTNNNNDNNNNSTSETNVVHFPSISRILSGSNGRKEDIPEVLLRTVTARPNIIQQASISSLSPGHDLISVSNTNLNNNNRNIMKNDNIDDDLDDDDDSNGPDEVLDEDLDDDILYRNNNNQHNNNNNGHKGNSNTKTTDAILHINHDNHTIQTSTISSSTTTATTLSSGLVNENKHKHNTLITSATSMKNNININNNNNANNHNNDDINTWTIAWNIHIYLTSILFTILAVYSIFKMIFYDKLTHLFQQSYFLIINCIIIFICLLRIFYLCYDAYNINNSFNNFISELLLNIPSIFLTITFTILIMYLILKGLNNKNNKHYKIILRPITIVIIFLIHIILCITLHYVENYSTRNQLLIQQQHLLKLQQQQQQHQQQTIDFKPLPRVLSLICQIIYIFVCFSLSIIYLYIYKIIKRIIKKKSHNYIPSYNNFLYAIHITIGISLLFLLLSAIQIYGAIGVTKIQSSMVTNYYLQQYYNTIGLINNQHNMNSPHNNNFININNNNWLEWGYQFSIRLIEISIIVLILWVTCLKTNTIINKNILKRCNNEQQMQQHQQQHQRNCTNQQQQPQHNHGGNTGQTINNGFILFPNCTSSSSQENFDIDYPAICNTNQNLHNYTMRTGKQIYDDNFVLNTFDNINMNDNDQHEQQQQSQQLAQQQQIYPRQATAYYKTNSIISSSSSSAATGTVMIGQKHQHKHNLDNADCIDDDDIISLGIPDHYENPNFELKNDLHHTKRLINNKTNNDLILDNCYSEPINVQQQAQESYTNIVGASGPPITAPTTLRTANGYDFQNFERPNFDRPNSRNEFRASKNLKTLKQCNNQMQQQQQCDNNTIGGAATTSRYNNSGRNGNFNYNNSFDRRCIGPGTGVRKSGTLNNIGNYGRNNATMQQQLQQQQQQQQLQQGSGGGMQSLCNSRSQDRSIDFSNRRNFNTNSKRGCGPNDRGQQQLVAGQRTSLERQQQLQQQTLNGHLSSSSSDLSAGDTSINGTKIYYPPNVGGVGSGIGGGIGSQQSCGSGGESSGNSGSMLVAEHGFIRFRALEDMRQQQQQMANNSSIRTSGRSGGGSNCSNTGGATTSTASTTGTGTSSTTSKKSEHHPIHP